MEEETLESQFLWRRMVPGGYLIQNPLIEMARYLHQGKQILKGSLFTN